MVLQREGERPWARCRFGRTSRLGPSCSEIISRTVQLNAGVENMINLVLLGVLALTVGGCACVVWAERGGPRWARRVATVTLAGSEFVRRSHKRRNRSGNRTTSGGD